MQAIIAHSEVFLLALFIVIMTDPKTVVGTNLEEIHLLV
jgi:hypothetical protein